MHEQTDPAPRPVPGPPPGGSGRDPQHTDPCAGIEEAVDALDALDDLPLAEHVDRFDTVHTQLAAALSSIDRV